LAADSEDSGFLALRNLSGLIGLAAGRVLQQAPNMIARSLLWLETFPTRVVNRGDMRAALD
jgi:hypothetical protein